MGSVTRLDGNYWKNWATFYSNMWVTLSMGLRIPKDMTHARRRKLIQKREIEINKSVYDLFVDVSLSKLIKINRLLVLPFRTIIFDWFSSLFYQVLTQPKTQQAGRSSLVLCIQHDKYLYSGHEPLLTNIDTTFLFKYIRQIPNSTIANANYLGAVWY